MSKPGLTELIHAMMLEGYRPQEIHQILTSAGYPSTDTWLLIEKIHSLLEDMEIEPRTDRLQKIVRAELERFRAELVGEIERTVRSLLHKRKGPQG